MFDHERANLDAARRWLQVQVGGSEIDELLIADAYATVDIGDLRYSKRPHRKRWGFLSASAAGQC